MFHHILPVCPVSLICNTPIKVSPNQVKIAPAPETSSLKTGQIFCDGMTDYSYWSKHSPNGGIQWLLVKPWTISIGGCAQWRTPPSGDACSDLPVHCHGHKIVQQSRCIFTLLFCLLLPWRPLRQYWASSCQMAASSGFQYSPWHAASGIAPAHSHGYQNDLRRRHICLSSLIFVINPNRS